MDIGKGTRYLFETKALFGPHNSLWLDKGFEYQNKLPCTNMSYKHQRIFCEKINTSRYHLLNRRPHLTMNKYGKSIKPTSVHLCYWCIHVLKTEQLHHNS